jgi:hypothetical protein
MRRPTALIASILAVALAAALASAAPLAAGEPAAADTTPPETTLEQPPTGLVAGSPMVFYYGSDDYFGSFECRIDGAPFEHCGFERERLAAPLPDGPHSFEVRAVDQAGNVDATPAGTSFIVDGTPPTLTLTSGPHGIVRDPQPTFRFEVSGGGQPRCKLERELGPPPYPWGPCAGADFFTPPLPLADDTYYFSVHVRDPAGNGAEERRRFRVYTGPGIPPSPYAGSVLYTGRGKGVKAEFRVKHRRLVWAGFVVRLNCIGPKGRRHPDREYLVFAEPGWGALPLHGRGRFRWGVRHEEPGAASERKLAGTVRPRSIVGRVAYYTHYDHRRCRTGTRSDERLWFRAYRGRR